MQKQGHRPRCRGLPHRWSRGRPTMEEHFIWMTTRQIQPGTLADFERAWRPEIHPEGMLASPNCSNLKRITWRPRTQDRLTCARACLDPRHGRVYRVGGEAIRAANRSGSDCAQSPVPAGLMVRSGLAGGRSRSAGPRTKPPWPLRRGHSAQAHAVEAHQAALGTGPARLHRSGRHPAGTPAAAAATAPGAQTWCSVPGR